MFSSNLFFILKKYIFLYFTRGPGNAFISLYSGNFFMNPLMFISSTFDDPYLFLTRYTYPNEDIRPIACGVENIRGVFRAGGEGSLGVS